MMPPSKHSYRVGGKETGIIEYETIRQALRCDGASFFRKGKGAPLFGIYPMNTGAVGARSRPGIAASAAGRRITHKVKPCTVDGVLRSMSESPVSQPAPPSAPGGSHDDKADAPDAVGLSALISSRVCHDLINPVGAIGSGLDVLDDPEMDETMRDAALDLIRSGAKKALALLTYARLAYGAAGGFGAEISMEDAKEAMQAVYDNVKPELDWKLPGGMAPKETVKTLLILTNFAADCVPRGGVVAVEGDLGAVTITATGKRIYLQEDLVKALKGEARGLTPKFTPALIVSELVKSAGGSVSASADDDKAVISIAFSKSA